MGRKKIMTPITVKLEPKVKERFDINVKKLHSKSYIVFNGIVSEFNKLIETEEGRVALYGKFFGIKKI